MKGLLSLYSAIALSQVPHQHHPSSREFAKLLEDPTRDEWQKPHEVLTALDLKSTETIADIGAGTGYFSRRFANHAAKVFAVDLDEKLLAIAAKNAPANLKTILAATHDPRLHAASVDAIFFCDVLHHLENRAAYYTKLAKALKPGGRIAMIDFRKVELPIGPPVEKKLSEDDVIGEMKAAGFKLSKRAEFLPYQYFLTFAR
jgi:arsenite methyltransferase